MSVSKQTSSLNIYYNHSLGFSALRSPWEKDSTEVGSMVLPVLTKLEAEKIIMCFILPFHCPFIRIYYPILNSIEGSLINTMISSRLESGNCVGFILIFMSTSPLLPGLSLLRKRPSISHSPRLENSEYRKFVLTEFYKCASYPQFMPILLHVF